MLWFLLLAAAIGSETAASAPATRSLALHVYTKKLVPIEDLKPEETTLTENGKARSILGVELDRRPIELAVVLDSSGIVAAGYRSDLVPAVIDFMKALPEGTKVAVWSTAPAKVSDFGSELPAVDNKLRMIAAAGMNHGFDSMIDASKELARRNAPRRAVVYVGGGGFQSSRTGTSALMQALGESRVVPRVVLVLPSARGSFSGGPSGDAVQSWDVQGYFAQMTKAYGGSYVEALSTMAVAQWLKQAAADLKSEYRVRYESEAGPTGVLKVEVRRKDSKFRVGRSAEIRTVD